MEQQVEGPIRPEQVIQDKKELTNEQVKIINRLIRQCYIPGSGSAISMSCLAQELGMPLYYFEYLVGNIRANYEPLGWEVRVLKGSTNPIGYVISFCLPLKGNKE
jgi:hypothetical protein